MKIVVFGLSVSSSWGNGHATLWRGLFKALSRQGHHAVFFERDMPYYAAHRDPVEACSCDLVLFTDWGEVARRAAAELATADVGLITSFCPDAMRATDLLFSSRVPLRVFYDLDMPVTLERFGAGDEVPYLGSRRFADFDLVLSFTGGPSLDAARDVLGAKRVAPLYGSVDPEIHRPAAAIEDFQGSLSYLGTFADDRQAMLDILFFKAAERRPNDRFVLAGPLYPDHVKFPANVRHLTHVAPAQHPSFYSSSLVTVSVTRGPMKKYGFCPSGRLFEAAACGVPILSDRFDGLDAFFEPDREILVADTTEQVLDVLSRHPSSLASIASRARNRVLDEHTATVRARHLVDLLGGAPRAHEEAS
jgi:spore maturation protein CgeB